MPRISDKTAITLDLKWLILFGGMLLSAGGMAWQMKALTDQVAKLEAQQHATERAVIETVVTLKVKGVIQ